jgi:membrane carboxypeptidase/penicillin-binding protein PbpC
MNKKDKKYIIILWVIILIIIWFLFLPINLDDNKSSTIIFDSNNIEIWEIIAENKIRHRFKGIDEIPEFTKKATILLEDKNFYNNLWIDLTAIIRAIINNIKSWENIEWASTISTQVIRNKLWLNEERTYIRKLAEFSLALSLNIQYSKNQILEYYLNNIYYWYLNYWIWSASKYYFDKDIKNLTKAEQIALLIIPKNPSKYNPYTNIDNFNNRFEKVTNYLKTQWLINEIEAQSILSEVLFLNQNHDNKLPYIVDFIKKNEINKSIINTTIDYNLTKKIENISKNIIDNLLWKDVWDYWVLIVDKKTNELKVMIWWIDYYLENWQVNSTTSLRQVWSTIKPFTYLLSFKDLWYSPETKILDLPIQFNTADGNTYSPKNYSLDYKWEISLAEALSQSINIPAVKLTDEIWLNRLYNFLKLLKISSIDKQAEYYWLALTLWVSEMTLYDLLQAYTIFSNDWNLCEINYIYKEKNCEKIIEKKYTNMISEILTNRYFKLKWFPINSNLDFENKKVFVKTGTSRNFRDNWTIGFTDNYLIWVWAWNKDWAYMKWVSWATWAWEIFREIVDYLEPEDDNYYDKKIVIPKDNKTDFLEIISPLDESVYKIDSNKPKNVSQIKLDFKTNIDYDDYKWLINNNELDSNFLNTSEWNFEVKIELYKNWELIWHKISNIEILE